MDALTAAVAALQTALANEASARAAADSTLQTNINSEASSRAAADAALDARVGKFEGSITAADLEAPITSIWLRPLWMAVPTQSRRTSSLGP